MSDLVLHHYAMSPFSQKIRSMLGYAGLEWQSVVCKEMPPRPHLETLAGGYRKMPVGQIGADIFCDTRSIATEIARLAGKPELALENCSAEVQAYVARVDLEMFFACLLSSGTLRMAMKVWRSMSLLDIARFFADRIKLGRKASVKAIGLKEARKLLHEHLADMESRLEKADFLFGNKPNHADFSAFHSLWFAVDLAESKHADDYPAVQGWLARLRAFGEGSSQEISIQQSLDIAQQAQPRPLAGTSEDAAMLGRAVAIGPSDYAKDQTQGKLIHSDACQWVVERLDSAVGTVHVHFPKQGYQLKPL